MTKKGLNSELEAIQDLEHTIRQLELSMSAQAEIIRGIKEPMDIVIYHLMLFSWSWRTDVIIEDYIYGAFSRLYRAEVILVICDFMSLG